VEGLHGMDALGRPPASACVREGAASAAGFPPPGRLRHERSVARQPRPLPAALTEHT
jgi:hypothetical protein